MEKLDDSLETGQDQEPAKQYNTQHSELQYLPFIYLALGSNPMRNGRLYIMHLCGLEFGLEFGYR